MTRWLLALSGIVVLVLVGLSGYYFYICKFPNSRIARPGIKQRANATAIGYNGLVLAEVTLPQGWSIVADCGRAKYLDKGEKFPARQLAQKIPR